MRQQVTDMKETLKRWLSYYKKPSNKRKLQKADADLQNLITPEDVTKFSTSQPAKDAVKVLGSAAAGRDVPLSLQEYTTVRDFLLSEIILRNANRPGVLANMKKKAVSEARLIDGHYVVSVADHKTASVHGPAKIVLSKTLHSWLTVFIKNYWLSCLPVMQTVHFWAGLVRAWTADIYCYPVYHLSSSSSRDFAEPWRKSRSDWLHEFQRSQRCRK
jgi:hypothetical protein